VAGRVNGFINLFTRRSQDPAPGSSLDLLCSFSLPISLHQDPQQASRILHGAVRAPAPVPSSSSPKFTPVRVVGGSRQTRRRLVLPSWGRQSALTRLHASSYLTGAGGTLTWSLSITSDDTDALFGAGRPLITVSRQRSRATAVARPPVHVNTTADRKGVPRVGFRGPSPSALERCYR
jgi:hypothetical protein